MLRLLADSALSPPAAPARRRAPRAGARRPRIVRREGARREAAWRAPGPSTDDPAVRRRELLELGRLALAHAMREGLAR